MVHVQGTLGHVDTQDNTQLLYVQLQTQKHYASVVSHHTALYIDVAGGNTHKTKQADQLY